MTSTQGPVERRAIERRGRTKSGPLIPKWASRGQMGPESSDHPVESGGHAREEPSGIRRV